MDVIGNMRTGGYIGVRKLELGMFLEKYMIDGTLWVRNGAIWAILLVLK